MAAKGFWQSMTGWMGKPGESSPEQEANDSSQPATPAQPNPFPTYGAGSGSMLSDPGLPSYRPSAAVSASMDASGPAVLDGPDAPEINRKIINVIKTCYDPEIPVNIFELGLIYDINVDPPDHAHIKMTLTAPNCPAAQSLPAEVKFKVEALDEIKTANVEIVFEPQWTPNKMTDAAKLTLNML
jgi:FeS assembly SUF system protein